jgi:glycosyltransferase involved in cell wall biosynthesis
MKPLISIIIPTFNRGYVLDKAINSILVQAYNEWELIIVDDGSTDNTKDIIEQYNNPKIKYLYQEKNGQCAARNKGLEIAKGDWIAYLDSDNEFYPHYLETVLKRIAQKPNALYALVQAKRTLELFENGKLMKLIDDSKDFPPDLTIQDIFHKKLHTDINGFFHSKQIIQQGIKFDEDLPKFEDWDFLMKIGNKFPDNFLYINVQLLNYHQKYGGDGVVSNSTYREWANLYEYIYQKHKNDKLMQGQTWYPERVRTWNKRADDFEKGLLPPYQLWYFSDIGHK